MVMHPYIQCSKLVYDTPSFRNVLQDSVRHAHSEHTPENNMAPSNHELKQIAYVFTSFKDIEKWL